MINFYSEEFKALARFLVDSLLSPEPRHKSWALRIMGGQVVSCLLPESEFSRLIHAPQPLPDIYLGDYRDGLPSPRFVEPLLSRFKDADAGEKLKIALHQRHFPDPRVAEALIAGMKDPDPKLRHVCLGGLSHQYSLHTGYAPRVLEVLKTALADPDPKVQEMAGAILNPKKPPQQETRNPKEPPKKEIRPPERNPHDF